MEYIYAAMILHEIGEEITEKKITGILNAAGASVEESRVKALIAALEDVNIEEALKTAATTAAPSATPSSAGGNTEKEEAEEEPEEEEEEEDLGLGALFG